MIKEESGRKKIDFSCVNYLLPSPLHLHPASTTPPSPSLTQPPPLLPHPTFPTPPSPSLRHSSLTQPPHSSLTQPPHSSLTQPPPLLPHPASPTPPSPSLLELFVPVRDEATGHHLRLVLVAEVSKVVVHQWASPPRPHLLVLPPPRDARQKCGIFLKTWTTLNTCRYIK